MGKSQQKWQLKLMQFMRGRYGRFDTLSKHVLYVVFGLMIVNLFLRNSLISTVVLIGMLLAYYRLFSKKIYVRSNENQKYLAWWAKAKKPFTFRINQFKYRKDYRYYSCTSCKQHVRVPRNRGKIMITCPSCHTKFEKKT